MFLQPKWMQPAAARALVVFAGIALTAAACGGSSSGGGNTQSVSTKSGGSTGATAVALTTHSGPDGQYLTDAKSRTVYIFSKDTGTSSTCSGACAKEWPPVTTSDMPTTSGSATASMVGTTDRSDGTTQATYNGHPLYYFDGDQSAGDMKGQGLDDFGGKWAAVNAAGAAVTTSQPSSAPSSSSGSSSEWG